MTYYTDILYKNPFIEGSLLTSDKEVNSSLQQIKSSDVVDMEGTAIYEASSIFINTQHIYILKMVSDYLNPNNLHSEILKDNLKKSSIEIMNWINFILTNYKYNDCICKPRGYF